MRLLRPTFLTACASALLLPSAPGQGLLFTTSQPETTMSGSGGTVLRFLKPNEIAVLEQFPCPGSAEKWAPRTMFHTQAGDEDGDDSYWEPSLFNRIDALVTSRVASPIGIQNQRTVFYSPSAAMGNVVSGGASLRPGDVGRIVRQGGLDGQVQYFIRAEQIQLALGLAATPAIVDVDAIAASPNYGVFFSLDTDIACNLCSSGPTLVRDGDLLMIPAADLVWSTAGTVAAVTPGRAVVVHTELAMTLMVQNATVTDRTGACVTAIGDLESLEIDWSGALGGTIGTCSGVHPFPHFLFTGETLTGGAILTTNGGGSIANGPCAPYGTLCGFGPTLGLQIGLRPPTAAMGIPSFVNALASERVCRFVSEGRVPQIPVFTSAQIDFASPGALTWVFLAFAPSGPGVVAPSSPFSWGLLCYPDYYAVPNFMGTIGTATGFGTYTSPAVPWPTDLVFYGITITSSGGIEVSTPSTIEVF